MAATLTILTLHKLTEIYNIAKSISSNISEDVQKILTEFDIDITIKIITSLIEEFTKEHNIEKLQSPTIKICFDSIEEILKNMKTEKKKLEDSYEYNKSLWVLVYFRSLDVTISIDSIKKNSILLDKRLKTLIEILQIKELTSEIIEHNSTSISSKQQTIKFHY